MVKSFLKTDTELHSSFYKEIYADRLFETTNNLIEIEEDYFNKLVLVSFNIFDSYITNNKKYKNYYYIGLKESENKLKELNSYFENDFYESLINCKIIKSKKDRWLKAIQNLESDDNFFEMHLNKLMDEDITKEQIITQIKNMSSGHATVLVTISQLVDKVEEKTLVLFDEPESHLHPPLLSAFIRALSDLLDNRNGVAIIATHSPIILQEIPKSCVWKIVRSGIETKAYRPKEETFGENVGILTNEVFGFEVHKSGFHKLLQEQVDKGDSYEQILKNFNNQLGNEGQFLLRTLLKFRKNNGEQ